MPDGSRVTIDAQGRTTRIEVDGVRTDQPASRNKYLEATVGQVGGAGFQGGHLYGRQFGGASEVQNLVPMHADANRAMLEVETELASAASAGAKVSDYRIEVLWGASPDVPEAFYLSATITESGVTRTVRREIDNIPGAGR